jgi:hypothetical protein
MFRVSKFNFMERRELETNHDGCGILTRRQAKKPADLQAAGARYGAWNLIEA